MPRYHGQRLARVLASPQFRDGKFHNTSGAGPALQGPSFRIMREFFLGGRKRVPHAPLPVESPLDAWTAPPQTGLRLTWFGHSTMLIEIDGARVLTDPVFCERASPVSFAGPKRFHPVPATIAQLPPLDAVLLSHDHHDHLCPSSIRELAKRGVPFITSLGVGARLEKLGVEPERITELDWWEDTRIPGTDVTLTAAPAQHFSGRGLTDRNTTLWSSWVIASEKRRVFFSGDTGLTNELADIAARFGPFDVSLIEIGAWHPAWNDIHLGPAGAVRAFELMGRGTFVPIHWGTFDLALHKWNEPPETLLSLAAAANLRVLTPPIGRAIEPAQVDGPTPWWRSVPG